VALVDTRTFGIEEVDRVRCSGRRTE